VFPFPEHPLRPDHPPEICCNLIHSVGRQPNAPIGKHKLEG
jgi:hypothetical protein